MLAPNSRLCLESAIAKLSFPSPLSVHITSVKSSARPHARKGRSDNTATKPPTLPNSYFAPVLEFNLSLPPPPPLQSNITTTHAHLELADYRTDLSDLPAVTTLSTRNDRWPPPLPSLSHSQPVNRPARRILAARCMSCGCPLHMVQTSDCPCPRPFELRFPRALLYRSRGRMSQRL